MTVTLQIPDPLAQTLGYAADVLPARILEALLIEECVQEKISRGKVAEILGLSFHEAEELFRRRRVPYPIKSGVDDIRSNAEQVGP